MSHRSEKTHRVTIRTVADEAGVSVQTVSRVLNDHPDVAIDTAERVRAVIQRLNYTPSAVARTLIQQRSFTIGVAIDAIDWVGPARMLAGITYEAEARGYCLLIKRIPEADDRQVQPLLQTMLSRQVDGIVWCIPEIGDNHRWVEQTCRNLGVPIVFMMMPERQGLISVAIDNYKGACLAVQHLLDEGYQHIAHVSGPLSAWEAYRRCQGWQDTLLKAGYHPEGLHSHEAATNWSPESAGAAFEALLAEFPQMDAVFVASDQMALKVLQIAGDKHIRVPQQLGVVGYDGTPESSYYWPSLTTVNHDHVNLGIRSARVLVNLIEGNRSQAAASILLEPSLIIRRSTKHKGGLASSFCPFEAEEALAEAKE